MSEPPPLRVAAVSLPALPAVDPSVTGPIGGTEIRAWTLCRGLAARGVDVSLVVRGTAPDDRRVDGVRLIELRERMYDWYVRVGRSVERTPRFPFLRMTRPEPSLLWRLPIIAGHRAFFGPPSGQRLRARLRELPADVLLTFGVTAMSAAVLDAGKSSGRPVVVAVGCDDDLDTRYATDPQFVSPYGDRGPDCFRVLTESHEVLVQTETQAAMLRDRFGRDGVVLPNPIDREVWSPAIIPKPPEGIEPDYLLWVGRAEGVHKRPQLLVELARMCPQTRFLMVLNPADPVVERDAREAAPPNVEIVSRVAPSDMPAVFAAARCLVNTSAVEGFPNTYLQAAAVGLPVLSLTVLGDWLVRYGVGRGFGGDLMAMADAVAEVDFDAATRDAADVVNRHDLTTISEALESTLRRTAGTPNATS